MSTVTFHKTGQTQKNACVYDVSVDTVPVGEMYREHSCRSYYWVFRVDDTITSAHIGLKHGTVTGDTQKALRADLAKRLHAPDPAVQAALAREKQAQKEAARALIALLDRVGIPTKVTDGMEQIGVSALLGGRTLGVPCVRVSVEYVDALRSVLTRSGL